MARYIDVDKIVIEEFPLKDHELIKVNECAFFGRRNGKAMMQIKDYLKRVIDNAPTEDVVPRSEYDAVVNAVDNSTKEFLKLHDAFQQAKQEAYKEILELIPPKMISESVRYDSPYGISRKCNVSMEEAEIIKGKYYKLQELRKKYIGEGQ